MPALSGRVSQSEGVHGRWRGERLHRQQSCRALTLNGIGVSCANIPAGYHLPHKDDEFTVVAELEHTLAFIRHFVTTKHRRFPHTYKTNTQQMIEGLTKNF